MLMILLYAKGARGHPRAPAWRTADSYGTVTVTSVDTVVLFVVAVTV
jgi:hypothetical protein